MASAYFDHAAAAPLLPEAREAMLPFLFEEFGSPASLHRFGERPRQAVETARAQVAALINCRPEEVVFTASGSESNNTAIKGLALARRDKGNHIIVSAIEHVSVLEPVRSLKKLGFVFTELPVDRSGTVDAERLVAAIRPETVLISVMHANYEVGTVQNIMELTRIAREHRIPFHCDGAAVVGRLPADMVELGVDAYSFPAQSVYGPKGAGALFLKRGTRIQALVEGGFQEKNRRAGTENVAAIAGFGKAAEVTAAHLPDWTKNLFRLGRRIIDELPAKLENIVFTGCLTHRLPGHVSMCVEFVEGESMLLFLDDEGISTASGSSCTARTLKASHVLLAMGFPHALAQTSLVLTMGKDNTDADVDHFVSKLPPIVQRLRQMSPLYAKFQKGEDPYAVCPGATCEDDHHHTEEEI